LIPDLEKKTDLFDQKKTPAVGEQAIESFAYNPDSTENEGRYAFRPTDDFDDMGMETSKFKSRTEQKGIKEEGIRFTVGTIKGNEEIQDVRFDKSKWTEEQAGKWLSDNTAKLGKPDISGKAPEAAPNIGEKGSIVFGKPKIKSETEKFTFSDSEIEERYNKSKGLREEPFFHRIMNNFIYLSHLITREYEKLPKNSEFAQLRFDLLQLAKQKGVASGKIIRDINTYTSTLGKDDYYNFGVKVMLDDLASMIEENDNVQLPWGLDAEKLIKSHAEITKTVEQSTTIQKAIEERNKLWDKIKSGYIDNLKSIGFDVSKRLTKKNYFRHQVLDYARAKTVWGSGKKLKTPTGRGHLKERKGSGLDINSDYLQAEHEVMAQMTYDIEVAKTIKAVDNNYNIIDKLKKEAKEKKVDWEDLIPEGYTIWQPREGNLFYLTESIPAKIAEMLNRDSMQEIGITKEQLNKVFAMGGKRKGYVIKEEIANTLDNLVTERSPNVIAVAHKNIIRKWKQWQLTSPRRYPKYNIRNMTGDADAVFVGRPSVFLKTPQAITELLDVYTNDKPLQGNVADWFDRGGTISTLQAQEMDELHKFGKFIELHGKQKVNIFKNTWHKYWNVARISTDFRESILRYAAYLRFKEEMEQNTDGMPNDFAASKPKEIRGLKDIKDRAYWMSNDLLGAYDRVGRLGQYMRENLFPFWSWKEVNFRRSIQLFMNAANDGKLSSTVGRKALGSLAKAPYRVYRVGRFMIQAGAFLAMVQVWNHLMFGDEENDLPENVKNKPHIVFGRDKNGNVLYFSRIGALGDLLEWGNLDATPFYVNQFFKGKMSAKEVALDIAKAPVNTFMQGIEPFGKMAAELLTRRSFYPDAFKTHAIRDRGIHIARGFGLENEYTALMGKPSRKYKESIGTLFYYKVDPEEAAYRDIYGELMRFKHKIGKGGEGFWMSEKSNALYNVRLSMRYKDKNSARKYLKRYFELGGTTDGYVQSMMSMNPLYSLSNIEQNAFAEYLGTVGMAKMPKAIKYYVEIVTQKEDDVMNMNPDKIIKRVNKPRNRTISGDIKPRKPITEVKPR